MNDGAPALSPSATELWQYAQAITTALATSPPEDPVTVWTARLVHTAGTPTGEWGLQAHTWQSGMVTTSLFAVCRDAEDEPDRVAVDSLTRL